jgi:hypothetical protein
MTLKNTTQSIYKQTGNLKVLLQWIPLNPKRLETFDYKPINYKPIEGFLEQILDKKVPEV